jgi:hypothetical protein
MPHICTRCNNVFDSGEDILKGCPVCGWKKFMFVKKKPQDDTGQPSQPEQIINKAMGVRIPPRRAQSGTVAIDRRLPPSGSSPSVVLPSRTLCSSPEKKSENSFQRTDKKTAEGNALESIKITAPGTYELNLPSLFERDELIMAVKEGTYFIDLTSAFKKGKKD